MDWDAAGGARTVRFLLRRHIKVGREREGGRGQECDERTDRTIKGREKWNKEGGRPIQLEPPTNWRVDRHGEMRAIESERRSDERGRTHGISRSTKRFEVIWRE